MSLPTQKTILKENYTTSGIYPKNEMNNIARMLNNIQGKDGVRVDTTPYGITISSDSNTGDPNYDFKTWANTSSTSVDIYNSRQIRNGCNAFVDDISTVAVTCDGNDQYIIATISSSEGYNDALRPDTLAFSASATRPLNDELNTQRVIATVATNASSATISSVVQEWLGGEIDDVAVIPDGNTTFGTAPERKTIEKNPAGAHRGELQLYNVDTAEELSKSISYFDADVDAGGVLGAAGEIKWAALDTELNGNPEKSIQVSTNATGTTIAQVFNFRQAVTAPAPADDDLFLFKNVSQLEMDYLSLGDLADYINSDYDCDWVRACVGSSTWLCDAVSACWDCSWLETCETYKHYNLSDVINLYKKHDHGNYFQNADSENGRYANASWDYQVNFCTSFGNAAKALTVHLDNQTLNTGAQVNATWSTAKFDINSNSYLQVNNTTVSTAKDEGCAVFSGGIGVELSAFIGGECKADRFELIDSATNVWDDTEMKTNVSANMDLSAGANFLIGAVTDIRLTAVNLKTFIATETSIQTGDMKFTVADDVSINGDTCASINDVFEKGLFINTVGATWQKIDIADGDGGTKEFWCLGKDA